MPQWQATSVVGIRPNLRPTSIVGIRPNLRPHQSRPLIWTRPMKAILVGRHQWQAHLNSRPNLVKPHQSSPLIWTRPMKAIFVGRHQWQVHFKMRRRTTIIYIFFLEHIKIGSRIQKGYVISKIGSHTRERITR